MNWPNTSIESIAASSKYACVGGPFGSKLTGKDYVSDGVPVIRGANMGERFISNDDFVFVTESKVTKDLSGNLAHPGDVVFTQRGTLGQVSLVPKNGKYDQYVISQSQMKLTVDTDKADAKFIYYYFSSKETIKKILNYVSTSGVPHINLTVLRNFEIPLPKLEQQQEVARILSTYDDLIENNKRRIELLEESARQLYKEWFVRFRFPGHEHVKIIDGVPEGWKKKPFKDLLSLNYGKALKAENRIPGAFPVYGSSGVVGSHNKALVKGPAIIVGRKGNVGAIHWSHLDFFPIDTVYFITSEESSYFVYYALLHTTFINTDVAVPGLNRDFAYSREIVVSSDTLREEFEEEVTPIFKQCHTLEKYNDQLGKARDLLLPKLMSGEIAV